MQYTQTPNTLGAALLDLALDSVAHRGETSRAQFGSLTVEVAVKPVWTTLVLSRRGYAPTGDEFRRLVDNWPEKIDFLVTPQVQRRGQLFFLKTLWPTVTRG